MEVPENIPEAALLRGSGTKEGCRAVRGAPAGGSSARRFQAACCGGCVLGDPDLWNPDGSAGGALQAVPGGVLWGPRAAGAACCGTLTCGTLTDRLGVLCRRSLRKASKTMPRSHSRCANNFVPDAFTAAVYKQANIWQRPAESTET